jgi:hypothetical protein
MSRNFASQAVSPEPGSRYGMLFRMNHRTGKVLGSVLVVAAAVLAFGNWRSSSLHRYVCGSDLPYTPGHQS